MLGIVGFGSIGRRVAELGAAFGMQVIVYTRSHTAENEQILALYGGTFVSFDELLVKSDIVSLHAPLTDETRGMIGTDQFSHMKKSTLFINTARGGLVDEKALIVALQQHVIACAALDVFANEPLSSDNPLLKLPNVILTPHIGASSIEAEEKASVMVANDIVAVLQGKEPQHAVA
jgi:phosphoglycerate dehydrogenase-like enzyme